jgi:hypothetical protein
MRNTTPWLILSCFTLLFLIGNSLSRDLVASCDEEYENCTASCIQRYSTPKYDIWNRPRRESHITRALRDKCKNFCLIGHKECIRRAKTREDEEKKQENIKSQVQIEQEETTTSAPPLSSNDKIYQWTDKNGVIHITNKKEAIPPEYQSQLEQGTNKETKAIKIKNNVEKGADNKTR